MGKLTVRGIEVHRPKAGEYKVIVDRGLHLRIAPDGRKTWLVRYVVDGKQIQARLPPSYGTLARVSCRSRTRHQKTAASKRSLATSSRSAQKKKSLRRLASHELPKTRSRRSGQCSAGPARGNHGSLLVDGNPADLVERGHVVPQGYVTVIRDRTLCSEKIRKLGRAWLFPARLSAA